MPFIDVPRGKLFYQFIGRGEPVLFIQGVGVAGTGWRPQVAELAREFACLSFDHRGIGLSAPPARELTIERMAADARFLMDAAGWESAHVVGHSMGGLIAQQLAVDTPRRVRSLSLLCTFSKGAEAARLTPWAIWMGLRTRFGTAPMRRRAFLEMIFPEEFLRPLSLDQLAEELAPVMGRDLAEQPPVLMQQLAATRVHDCSARLGELAPIPTLVVSGADDPIARPEYGRRLHGLIPNSRYLEIPRASHGVTIQEPRHVNALLRDHFRHAAPGRAPSLVGSLCA